MIGNVEKRKLKKKPLGVYLVEAGIITPAQVEMAIDEQNYTRRRLGEILVERGWVEQQTIEYFMEKVVLPERGAIQKKLSHLKKDTRPTLTVVEQASKAKTGDSDSLLVSPVPSHELEVHFSPRKTMGFLLIVVLGLVLVSLTGQFTVYFLPNYLFRDFFTKLFNINSERSIPALYSGFMLLVCSSLLAIIACTKKVASNQYVRHWGALSIIFLYLSLDELVSIHERMFGPLHSVLNANGFFYFTWVLPSAIFVLICLLGFQQFLTNLPTKTKHLFLIAGTVFVIGAIGIELVGGYYAKLYGQLNMTYAVITTFEECLELLGIVIFIYALLSYISFYMKGMSIRVNIINDSKQSLNA